MSLNARTLRNVVTLAAHGNFRRAAQALHISQPALSRSVASLEASLGVRLFDRSRRGVTPTSFGQVLIDRGHALIAGLDDIRHEIALMRGLQTGELRIGAGLYPAEMSVGTAIGRMSASHPGLRITLRAAPWREVADAAIAGQVDIAVVELSALGDEPRLALEPLPRHRAVIVCRAGHPLLGQKAPTLVQVFGYPFAGPRLPVRVAGALAEVAPLLRVDASSGDAVPPLDVESIALAKRIVAAGNAVAALPEALVAAEIAAGTLGVVSCRPAWLHTNYGFAYRRDRSLSPGAQAFMDEVRAIEAAMARQAALPLRKRR